MKTVTILGATGSVGTSTLDLIERAPDDFHVKALTANCDVERLAAAAIRTRAELAVVAEENCLDALQSALAGTGIAAAGGAQAICDAARSGADVTMSAIVGCVGLAPTMAAIEGGKTVIIANKEPLVSAGEVVLAAAKASGATLLPADSEHNAIFQCLTPDQADRIRRIILTASGGPFRDWALNECDRSPRTGGSAPQLVDGRQDFGRFSDADEQRTGTDRGGAAVPRARLCNRNRRPSAIGDPFDGRVCRRIDAGAARPPDRRVPIAHCLAWPDRMATPMAPLDLVAIGRLDFEAPDEIRFPALALARQALDAGGARPAILNAANEVAVAAFLDRRIGFLEIAAIVADTLDRYDPTAPQTLDEVLAIDGKARIIAGANVNGRVKDGVS